MYRQANNQIYKTVVVVWLTLSVASVILAAVTWVDLSRKLSNASEAVAIQEHIDTILRLLVDAETAQRGHTITGDERFLEPLNMGETNIPAQFERLVEIVKEDSLMLKRVMELHAQAELSLAHHRAVVAARKAQGGQAAADIVATGEGRRIMDGVRERVAQIRGMRADLVSDNGAEARAKLLRASLTSLVAGVLGVGAGVFAFWLARAMLGHQRREK